MSIKSGSQPTPRVRISNEGFSPSAFGVARYSIDLLDALSADGVDASASLAVSHTRAWYEPEPNISATRSINYPRALNRLVSEINRRHDTRALERGGYEILHKTYYSNSDSPRGSVRTVTMLYDMIHQIMPHWFNRHDRAITYKYDTLQCSDRIICISQSSRNDLLNFWPEFEQKSSVVLLGVSDDFLSRPLDSTEKHRGEVLFVGSRKGYKNFWKLVEAMAILMAKFPETQWKLKVFGGGPVTKEERRKFEIMDFPSDSLEIVAGKQSELIECYQSANVLVYPSAYEGFGYPPLEAMALGCPVIASNSSSIPEVVGDYGLLLDVISSDTLCEAIIGVVRENAIPFRRLLAAKERAAGFSLSAMSRETQSVYKILLRQ